MLQSATALLSETWSFLLVRWRSVGVGLLGFTMLLAVNQAFFARQIDAGVSNVLSATSLTSEQFESQLVTLLRDGADAAEVNAILEALQSSLSSGRPASEYGFRPTPSNAALYFVITSMPLVFGMLVIAMAILLVSAVYFVTIAVQEARGAYDAVRKLPMNILKICGLVPWVWLRSLAVIPVVILLLVVFFLPPVAFVPALFAAAAAAMILLTPYVMAPMLVVSGQHGILQSAKLSFVKSRGHRMAIMGARLTLFLFLVLFVWVASGLVDVVSAFVPKAGILILLFVFETAVAFGAVYHVRLGKAILLRQRMTA